MPSPSTCLGYALAAVYFVTIWLLSIYSTKNLPQMAWWPMLLLSLIRFVTGVCIIFDGMNDVGSDFNPALLIATNVLIDVGAVALWVNECGFVRAVLIDNVSLIPALTKLMNALSIGTIVPFVLMVVGGSILWIHIYVGLKLILAGYCVFAILLSALIVLQLHLVTKWAKLGSNSRRILVGSLTAAPFIVTRNVYGILQVAALDSWYTLGQSLVVFGCMALLMEFLPICIWAWVGFSMPAARGRIPDAGTADIRYLQMQARV